MMMAQQSSGHQEALCESTSFDLRPVEAENLSNGMDGAIRSLVESSRVVDATCLLTIPRFGRNELLAGKLIGSGAFSHVYEIKSFCPTSTSLFCDFDDDRSQDRWAILDRSLSDVDKQGTTSFVMKHIQPDLLRQKGVEKFGTASIDLAREAHYLASFDHPHILSIRGWSASAAERTWYSNHGRADDFFLLLDRLDGTLEDRIEQWRQQLRKLGDAPQNTKMISKMARTTTQEFLFGGRLGVVRDIASALCYLHEKNMVYRDLKPENVGFCANRVKLFDFGLSREMPTTEWLVEQQQDDDSLHEMSTRVGTRRYMSPEVYREKPYNQKADVYSLALVTWEIMALQKPFDDMGRKEHRHHVIRGGVRPLLTSPDGIKGLLKRAWSDHVSLRPTMQEFHDEIEQERFNLRKGKAALMCVGNSNTSLVSTAGCSITSNETLSSCEE